MYKVLLQVILTRIAKFISFLKIILMSKWVAKYFSKNRLVKFIWLDRFIPTPKTLSHSILSHEMKVMRSFILPTMKEEKEIVV